MCLRRRRDEASKSVLKLDDSFPIASLRAFLNP